MQECIKQQQYTLELLPQLKEIYFCPDFEGRKCFRVTSHNVHNHSKTKWSGQYRKPRPGMLQLAMARYKHTQNNSLYVGDRPEDEEAAQRAGISFLSARDWIEQHRGVAEKVMI
jgi:D-glycero-D-manno-heptose 1,7-bisphosphate phosphatase